MDSRLNKPKVFLSHSKIDISFIEKISTDLRKCQIDSWIDKEEIRPGKPWLDAIFEDGISTCDAVLIYFTEASIVSKMVKKEMDVGILQQLKDGRVAFLPYVVTDTIRNKLRADIQALQVPIWNDNNYQTVLPSVVAEIWRSFLERMIPTAIQDERVKRLQAELELEKLRKESHHNIFSQSEEDEFSYLWKTFDRMVQIKLDIKIEKDTGNKLSIRLITLDSYKILFNLANVIALLIEADNVEHDPYHFPRFLADQAKTLFTNIESPDKKEKIYEAIDCPDLTNELMMYGFVDRRYNPPRENPIGRFMIGGGYKHIFNEKYFRFRYWLAYKKMLPDSISFTLET